MGDGKFFLADRSTADLTLILSAQSMHDADIGKTFVSDSGF